MSDCTTTPHQPRPPTSRTRPSCGRRSSGRCPPGSPTPSSASSSTGGRTRCRPGPSRAAPWARCPRTIWFTHNAYAEWYFNTIRIPGSPAAQHHAEVYGGAPYDDFLDAWTAAEFDPADWARLFATAGRRVRHPDHASTTTA